MEKIKTTLKLSEIFITLPGKRNYSAEALYALKLHPIFIKKMATNFDLTYVENRDAEGNLCFVENKEVRPEYRTTFGKTDVVKYIFSQLSGETVNIGEDKVGFHKNFFF